jgi:hypothetical protein
VQLGAEDTSRRLASTTTTVITTKAHAESHTINDVKSPSKHH